MTINELIVNSNISALTKIKVEGVDYRALDFVGTEKGKRNIKTIEIEVENGKSERTQSFFIEMPLKNFNQNEATKKSRGNKFSANSAKKNVQNEILYILKEQKVSKIKTPCKIMAIWNIPNENRDIDNLMLKNVLDAMQIANLIENDNLKYIKAIHNTYVVNKKKVGVELFFTYYGSE